MTNNTSHLGNALKTITVVFILFLIVSYFVSMFLGPAIFFFTPDGSALSSQTLSQLVFFVFPGVLFTVPIALNFGVMFIMLWCIYLACFLFAYLYEEKLHRVLSNLYKRPVKELFKNFLLGMPLITSVLITAVIILQRIQETQGLPTGSPNGFDPFEFFFALTYSPIIEEIGFRIIPIGVFLAFYFFLLNRENTLLDRLKTASLGFFFPEKAKKKLGLEVRITVSEWIMVILTSAIFGLAHWLSGWGLGKISTATLSGLVFGWAYLKYGAYASILLHWFFNYYFEAYILAGESFYWVNMVLSFVETTIMCVAFIGWMLILYLAVDKLAGTE